MTPKQAHFHTKSTAMIKQITLMLCNPKMTEGKTTADLKASHPNS